MFELIMIIAMIVAIARMAIFEDRSPWAWGFIAFGCVVASGIIPFPYVRIVAAFILAVVLMMATKKN